MTLFDSRFGFPLPTSLFLFFFLLPALALANPDSEKTDPETVNSKIRDTRPNFVIIILDDWGWRESGAYGNSVIQTPTIDRLAREGVQFNNTFLTASTCSSSRASILTGLHPFAAGVPRLHVPIPADRTLVSHYLREAGYFTAAAGKWHIGSHVRNQFDLIMDEKERPDQKHTGMEDWVSTIEHRLPNDKPFFLWLAAKDAHKPWFHEPEWSVHNPEYIQFPAYITFNKNHPAEVIRQEMALYYDEIHRVDVHIKQVIKALRKKDQLDNTVLIIMSDNGSPFWPAKKFLTDPGLKTPFIVVWPKNIKQPQEINELISAVDIAPTLLNLANVGIPKHMEGYSFASWLKTNTQETTNQKPASLKPIRAFVYGERGDGVLGSENGRSIRDKKHLYIVNDYATYETCDRKSKQKEVYGEKLFDVINDPDNLNNLASPKTFLENTWQKLRGENNYQTELNYYRGLMQARREKRNDLATPTIKGECPRLWWQENQEKKNNSAPASD